MRPLHLIQTFLHGTTSRGPTTVDPRFDAALGAARQRFFFGEAVPRDV